MNGKLIMYRSQYGRTIWARTVKELKEQAGSGKLFRIYRDYTKGEHAGKCCHVGYGIGGEWFDGFIPLAIEQN